MWVCFKCVWLFALQACVNVCLFWVGAGGLYVLGITQITCDFWSLFLLDPGLPEREWLQGKDDC